METKRPHIPSANPLFLPTQPHQTVMVDLHGMSVEPAQDLVAHHIKQARTRGWSKIRFVTGRGNHVNARGERGTLYKSFKDWLKDSQDHIAKIDQYDGYYEVDIKNDVAVRNPFSAFMSECVKGLLRKDIDEIKKAAEKGEVQARIALACCYDQGIGVEQSYQKATALYLELAEKEKLALAQYEVGCRFYIGKGIKQNDPQAIKFLTLAADQDYVLAEFILAEIHQKGFNAVPINIALATKYYFKAARHGHAESARKLGCAYHSGSGIGKDYAQAIHWWQKAAELGDCVAAFNLSAMYQDGTGVAVNTERSVHYLRLAAEYGDPDAQAILGYCYYYGDKDLPVDKKQGLLWIEKAANNNSSEAQFFLFHYYKALKEVKLAKEYLVKAALDDHIEAQFFIATSPAVQLSKASKESKSDAEVKAKTVETNGDLFAFSPEFHKKILESLLNQPLKAILKLESDFLKFGIVDLLLCADSTNKQIKKGIKILEDLAAKENAEALGMLGGIYMSGNVRTVKKDPPRGRDYWLQGAGLKDSDCLCGLGYFWYEGLGGAVDHGQAFNNFLQAANLGNANANNMLGTFYSDGLCGVKKDSKRAVKYFQTAMELDDPKKRKELRKARKCFRSVQNTFKYAARNLGMLYLEGSSDFPKNEAEGIKFLMQSAEDGMVESAIFLMGIFKEKKQMREFLYCLDLAARLRDARAIQMINTMPSELKAIMQRGSSQSEDKEPKKSPMSKEEIRSKLKKISDCLAESLDWNLPGGNSAWTYISDSLREKLIKIEELSKYVKRSNGKYLIAIKNIYECNLDELGNLFKKAVTAPTLTSGSAGASPPGLLAKKSLLTQGGLPSSQMVASSVAVPPAASSGTLPTSPMRAAELKKISGAQQKRI